MTTTTISAALPAAPSNTNRAPTDNHTEADTSGPSFSSVLTSQQSPRPTPDASAPAANSPGHNKNPAQTAPEVADTPEEAPELADTGLNPGLPQIALNIAAEAALAMAARHPAPAVAVQAEAPVATTNLGQRDLHAMLTDNAKALPGTASDLVVDTKKDARPQAALAVPTANLPANDKPVTLPAGFVPVPRAALAPHQTELNARKPVNLASAKPTLATGAAPSAVRAGDASLGKTVAVDFSTAIANLANKAGTASSAQSELSAAQAGSVAMAGGTAAQSTALAGNTASPLNPATQFTIPGVATPLQHPQWASDFGRQFISLAKGGHNMPHTAELRLDPPELGPLRISINISDNVAHAIFTSPHAAVRQTVENSLPQLQQLLAQAGISLGQTSVNDQAQSEQSFNESLGSASKQTATATGVIGDIDTAGRTAARSRNADALVDTFA